MREILGPGASWRSFEGGTLLDRFIKEAAAPGAPASGWGGGLEGSGGSGMRRVTLRLHILYISLSISRYRRALRTQIFGFGPTFAEWLHGSGLGCGGGRWHVGLG